MECSDADLVALSPTAAAMRSLSCTSVTPDGCSPACVIACADDGLVAEALQDTFVALWRGGDVPGHRRPWRPGCGAIAIRRLIGLLRKRHPEPVAYDERDQPVT